MAAVDEGRRGKTRTGRRGPRDVNALPPVRSYLSKAHNGPLIHVYIHPFNN